MTTARAKLALVFLMTLLLSLSRAFRSGRQFSPRISQYPTSFISPVQSCLLRLGRQRIAPIVPCRQGYAYSRPWAPQQQRQSSSLLAASSIPLQEGDTVEVKVNGESQHGVIQQVRGSGWYAVRLNTDDDANVIKVRSKQLSLVTTTTPQSASQKTVSNITSTMKESPVVVPPPTIIDIDTALQSLINNSNDDPVQNKRDLEYLQACAHHASFVKQWIVFTDLHCAPCTLNTCLQVLERVHAEALARTNAGILFLGDFWHYRATLRVDMLNAILACLKKWQVPSIFIPGNHDQVTLGGHNHGLTPLEHVYRVQCQTNDNGSGTTTTTTLPGPLVFSHPTKFMNALFVPHIRNVTTMESVLQSHHAKRAKCLFVHADVTGASMNDLIVSQGGVPPSSFPPNIPIYSGHFHKPHVVKTNDGVTIEYIGSPYQTSLAEAHQTKSLLVLDVSNNYKCVERIPLNIGRKHFRATCVNELLALDVASLTNTSTRGVQSGDRVVVTLSKQEIERERRRTGAVSTVNAQINTLRKAGAIVEVKEIPSLAVGQPLVAKPKEEAEEMTPQNTLTAYLAEQVIRESLTNDTAEKLLKAGMSLLEELELSKDLNSAMMDPSGNMTNLNLDSVSLQGFGSFKDKVTYPLGGRGLVLVRGTNRDGGGDSNGSGKSSLAMATLWALTGTLDPRPMQDSKVSDVVNDSSKSARVTVRGTLNDKPFVISRTKTSTKGALAFHLDGRDLTMQSIKDTQAIMDETLGAGSQIVARTMFHGQFAMNGLLEATDAKLKEELSLIVPLALWQQGASTARTKSREAAKMSSEFEGMIRLRTGDVEDLVKRRDKANELLDASKVRFEVVKVQVTNEVKELCEATNSTHYNKEGVHNELASLEKEIEELERALETVKRQRDSAVLEADTRTKEAEDHQTKMASVYHTNVMSKREAELQLVTVEAQRREIENKWNVEITSSPNVDVVSPQVCPTCRQPISDRGQGRSHRDMQRLAQEEVETVKKRLDTAVAALSRAEDDAKKAEEKATIASTVMLELKDELEKTRIEWAKRVVDAEQKLREDQARLSELLRNAANVMEQEANIQSKKALLLEQEKEVRACEVAYQDLGKSVHDAEERLEELHANCEAQRTLSETMTNLVNVFGPRGVQTFLLRNAIETLQMISQMYLDELSDGSQRLELKLDTGDRISRTAKIRGSDGSFVERPLSSLSGGQWRRCSLALSLAFAQLVSVKGRFQSSVMVLDEPLTHLDRSGRSRVGKLLRSLLKNGNDGNAETLFQGGIHVSTMLVILQDLAAEELEESFDHIDEVVKEDGMSTVSIDK